MRATEIIRAVLDILDQAEDQKEPERVTQNDDQGRFRSILAMLQDKDNTGYDNSPDEKYAGVDAVTTDAGGGVNGPKHPADIRVKDPRGY